MNDLSTERGEASGVGVATMVEERLKDGTSPQAVEETLPSGLDEFRAAARARFERLGLPSRRDEDWRYTNLKALAGVSPDNQAGSGLTVGSDDDLLRLYRLAEADSLHIVMRDGVIDRQASDELTHLPAGVNVWTWQEALAARGFAAIGARCEEARQLHDNGFIALNDAALNEGVYIEIAADVQHCPPVHLVHVHSQSGDEAEGKNRQLRHMLVVGERAQVALRETFVTLAPLGQLYDDEQAKGRHLSNAITDVFLAEGARCDHVQAQAEALDVMHISHRRVIQAGGSHYEALSVNLGGKLARQSVDVKQVGEHASTNLRGLYLARHEQQSEQRSFIWHACPNGKSRQYYKGIVDDRARGVFLGQVRVAPQAQKIAASQLNKNLLLSSTAEIDTKPVLEIEADDVKCSHGATVSQLRQDELFYLRCRGISEQVAKAMLAQGFVQELLFELKDHAAYDYLKSFLDVYFSYRAAQHKTLVM